MHNLAFNCGQKLLQDWQDICSERVGNEQIHNIIANSQYTAVYPNPDGGNPLAIFQPRNANIQSILILR